MSKEFQMDSERFGTGKKTISWSSTESYIPSRYAEKVETVCEIMTNLLCHFFKHSYDKIRHVDSTVTLDMKFQQELELKRNTDTMLA